MDREGSINHDPLILSFARTKWIKLEGLILGIVEGRSVPRVELDDRVSEVSGYGGGGLFCESAGDRAPQALTSVTHLFVSELEEDSMIIILECKLESGRQDGSNEFQVLPLLTNSNTASESIGAVGPLVHQVHA